MKNKNIAYFVSHHGFGHAARACAVMQAIHSLQPDINFTIFTRAPKWFFDSSLTFLYEYQETIVDVGLVQQSPLEEDLPATIQKLEGFLPFPSGPDWPIVQHLSQSRFDLCVCDISPYGLAAARAAGIPSVLIENFTWDWIYSGYLAEYPEIDRYISQFSKTFNSADIHIQTRPVCQLNNRARLLTNPIARQPRLSSFELRRRLRIPDGSPVVLITMGGFELDFYFKNCLTANPDIRYVIPGGAKNEVEYLSNLVLLPHHSNFYHPDLVNGADAVISKAGYSTIAEAFYAGIPFGYVSRDHFRESPVLSAFIQQNMPGFEIDGKTFQDGEWIDGIPNLLGLGRREPDDENGADQAARMILDSMS